MFYLSKIQKGTDKFLCLFLCLIMVFTLSTAELYVFAAANEDPTEDTAFTFEISSSKVKAGETIDIIVSMKNSPGFSGLKFDFSFENLGNIANIKPVSIKPLNDFTIGLFSSNLDELNSGANIDWSKNNIINVAWSDADNIIPTDIDLFSIRFDISKNAKSGTYPLNISGKVVDDLYQKLEYELKPGSIEVVEDTPEKPLEFLYGDTHYNNIVEIEDAIRLAQFLVNKVTYNQYETLAANVHYDLLDNIGIINTKDAIKLSQWLVEYEGVVLGDGPDGTGPGQKPER